MSKRPASIRQDLGPCAWREAPGLPRCTGHAGRTTNYREPLGGSAWQWVCQPLCWRHYQRVRRSAKALAHHQQALLTLAEIRDIRRRAAAGERTADLAEEYGVSLRLVQLRIRTDYAPGVEGPPRSIKTGPIKPARRPDARSERLGPP